MIDSLLSELAAEWCSSFDVRVLADGAVILDTPFLHPDGDGVPVYVERRGDLWVLSDRSGTLGRLDDDGSLFEKIEHVRSVASSSGGELRPDYSIELVLAHEPSAYDVAHFLGILAGVAGLRFLVKSTRRTTRYSERLSESVREWLPPQDFVQGWVPPIPEGRLYPADCWVSGADGPIVILGVGGISKLAQVGMSIRAYSVLPEGSRMLIPYQPKSISSDNVFRLQNQIGDKNVFGAGVGEWSELRARLRENGARLSLI